MMEVSIELARVIKEMCIGVTNGHMSHIPNNPTLYSIFYAISGKNNLSDADFAEILRLTANILDKNT